MSGKKKTGIPAETLQKVRDYCYFLADNSDDRTFELRHVRTVEENSIAIAEKRGLDRDTACLIAVLHDLGRIKNGIYGKGHAKEGAEIAEAILNKFGISIKTIPVITRAIKNHSKKNKFHDDYSELIKDADSMTRFRGLPKYDDDTPEYLRNKYAILGKCRIQLMADADVPDIVGRVTGEIKETLAMFSEGHIRPSDVHGIRVRIRQVRSAVWYLKRYSGKDQSEGLREIDSRLRKIFKDYEDARKLHVLRKRIRDAGINGKLLKYLTKARRKATCRLQETAAGRQKSSIDKIIRSYDTFLHHEPTNSDAFCGSKKIRRVIYDAKVKDVPSLHRLRILSKKLIYLHNMGIIGFSQSDFIILLKNIHRYIGLMNDRAENIVILKKLAERKPGILTKEEAGDLISSIYDYDALVRNVSKYIFELKVRF